jgi:DNA-binding LacI/PurR family transcriptional regulator
VEETGQIQDRALRARERTAVAGIREHLIDGVILNPLALDDADVERYGSLPLVLLGERLGSHLADHVAIDNEAAAAEATRHLISTGRRRIAVIGSQPPPFGHSARLRLRGYRDALVEAGIRYDPALVVPVLNWRHEQGRAAVAPLLALPEPPDAVFCFNDLLALGAVRGLADVGLRVPSDMAVVGFDDIQESRHAVPSLTTIAPDKQAIARHAVERLARRLEPGVWTPEEVRVGWTLQVRESSAA